MNKVELADPPVASRSPADAGPADTVALPSMPFLVLTSQRTGSGWLMDRINNVPGAQGHMELFYHDVRRKPAMAGCNDYLRFVEQRSELGRRPRAVFTYLDRLYARPGAVGFKLMYSQLREYPDILPYLALRRIRIVHLVRMNHLDVVISEALAQATGTAHVTVDDGEQRPVVVDVDAATIVQRVRWLESKQRTMRALIGVLPCPVLEVSYESLCEDDAAFDRVVGFIGASTATAAKPASRLVKRQRLPHEQVLCNYSDVAAALTRAGYRRLLH